MAANDATTTNTAAAAVTTTQSTVTTTVTSSKTATISGAANTTTSSSSKRKSLNATPTLGTTTAAMDNHPYARGAVIEVLHGVEEKEDHTFWSDDSSVDDDDDDHHGKKATDDDDHKVSVRLCDIIDRVSLGDGKWRYYIHYRDFNRRMDEWISMDRIVSPPSVGNAKARAMKKEEERKHKKKHANKAAGSSSGTDKHHADAAASATATTTAGTAAPTDLGPRSSRRRSAAVTPVPPTTLLSSTSSSSLLAATTATAAAMTSTTSALTIDTSVVATATAPESMDSETPRRTRLQRRKSHLLDDDNMTVVASNSGAHAQTSDLDPAMKQTLMVLPITSSTTTMLQTTVGEHVVATIPAQELDEHEGLDEASLREHEEVTKVKNVSFLELGPHRMETWYFSPLPKELLSEKGFAEVLYCCEFTLSLFARKSELQRFQARLPTHLRHPPGNEIYRNGNLSSTYHVCVCMYVCVVGRNGDGAFC
jgi:hypothetical protein